MVPLHPVQQALVDLGGSQCGYCTPGFVMSLFSEYYRPGRTEYDPEAISGNLCRCTGYRPIADAAKSLMPPPAGDPWVERLTRSAASMPALDSVRQGGFARPQSLDALFELLAKHPEAVLLAGGTDLMVDVNQRGARYPLLVSLGGVRELERFEVRPDEIVIGAGLTLSRLGERLQRSGDPSQTRLLQELLPLFSSRLIRNRATLGGNLATASPIGDAAPALLALNAELTLRSASGEQRLALQDFFVSYRRTVLRPAEVIVSVHLPRPLPRIQRFYKVSKRKLDDISTVAAAFALDLDGAGRIERLSVAYCGVAAIPLRAEALEQQARGLPWTRETVAALCSLAEAVGTPLSDHRGSADYRRAMMRALLERFHFETTQHARAAE
jgi:xanthine dehydrogenase small subunit